MPFMGFRRQERDKDGGEAVTAELVAKLLAAAGATDVMLCDPHSPKNVQYFQDAGLRTWVIDANPLFVDVLRDRDLSNVRALSPDKGRSKTTEAFAKTLGIPMISLIKSRPEHDISESHGIQGSLRGITAIIREDEISTAGTIAATEREVRKVGGENIIVMATHGVLAGGAIQTLNRAEIISKIYTTDSIYLPWEKRTDKIEQLSLAPLIVKQFNEMLVDD
jgi:ribose-phosphate pyrophosphokinase